MKRKEKNIKIRLLKTTMVAFFVASLLLLSSVSAMPFVSNQSNTLNIQQNNEMQAKQHNAIKDEYNYHTPLQSREDDVGVVSIDSPISGMATGEYTPQATINNYGSNDQTDVPVNFQIGYTIAAPGGFFFDFEEDDGGWIPTATWDPVGDWEWTNTYDVGNYVGGHTPPASAYSGDGLWGTVIYGDHTNAGGFSYLSQTFDFTDLVNPELSFYSWLEAFGTWDYGQVEVNGDIVWGPEHGTPTEWELVEINLDAYSGLSNVEITFAFYATTVVERSGWYIDDVLIGPKELVAEYDETVLVDIDAGESVEVSFPQWLPDPWHTQEDVTVNYDVWVQTNLTDDTNPDNDLLTTNVNIYFGFFNDIGIVDIISPDNGVGDTQTPEIEVKNFGQYDQIDAELTMAIEEIMYLDQWTMEEEEEWTQVNTNNAGGEAPEARLAWNAINGDYAYLMSPEIDTSGYSTLNLSFRSYINDYSGGYNCNVKITTDGVNWDDITPWTNPISGNVAADLHIINIDDYISSTTQVMFEFDGDYYSLNYWYIDDFECGPHCIDFSGDFPPSIMQYIVVYDQTVTFDISAGEIANIILPDWTPAAPFANIDYQITACTSIDDDANADNDCMSKVITLEYLHDVGTVEIIPFSRGKSLQERDDVIFHQEVVDPEGDWSFINCDSTLDYGGIENFEITDNVPIGKVSVVGLPLYHDGAGWVTFPPEDVVLDVVFYDDEYDSSPTVPSDVIATFTGIDTFESIEFIGTYSGFSGYEWTFELPDSVIVTDQQGWMQIEAPSGFMWGNSLDGDLVSYQIGGDPAWLVDDRAMTLYGSGGAPPSNIYAPGTYTPEAVIENFGTYTEVNFNVTAQILDAEGEIFWEDDVMVVSPMNPADTQTVTFGDVVFDETAADEGAYTLVVETALDDDEKPSNDKKTWNFIIDIYDDIPPETTHEITGVEGDNDWYVSDVTITLTAEDPWPYKAPVGVNNTYISFDGVDFELYVEPIVVTEDGIHEFWYYSDDYNENVEDVNGPFEFQRDATPPTIELAVEGSGATWMLIATVSDDTSGVALVEFYVNDEYLGEVTSAPFEWEYTNAKKGDIAQAIVYDNAGNSKVSDAVEPTVLVSQQTSPVVQVVQKNII
jgi:hypothetical protein